MNETTRHQTGNLPDSLSDCRKRPSACFPLFKHTAIYFPPSALADGPPFLSRTGNVLHAFHLSAFACFPFYKRTFQYLTISPWHMFIYKGRQKHVSFCHKSKQFRFLAKEILALRFPSLEREGDHRRWGKVESSL